MDKFGHHAFLATRILEEQQLIFGAHIVVFVVFYLIIGVAIEVVCQETYALHVGEKRRSKGQMADLYGG